MEMNNDHASIDITQLTSSLKREMRDLNPLSSETCIYRVHKGVRELHENVYTPQLVSVGPLHHGREDLKPMEEHKMRYLQDFLQHTKMKLEDCIDVIKAKETKIRNCYAETISYGSEDFIKIILADAVFLIETLLKVRYEELRSETDRIFGRPWMIDRMVCDIWMLENQLPFFVLEDVFELSKKVIHPAIDRKVSIVELANYFRKCSFLDTKVVENVEMPDASRVEHLLDFYRICILPSNFSSQTSKFLTAPSTVELHQAGVKFKKGMSENLFDMKFQNGTLEIAPLTIFREIEGLLSNLMAFEQCHCLDHYVNDYVSIMNDLVNTPKDAEMLVQDGIIENHLWSSERLSLVFNKLAQGTRIWSNHFYYSGLVEDLNGYCRKPRHKWKAILKQKYFQNPWTFISLIAACILLALTFIQAACSILALQ